MLATVSFTSLTKSSSKFRQYARSLLEDDFVNDVNDTVASIDIRSHDIRNTPIVFDLDPSLRCLDQLDLLTAEGGDVAGLDSRGWNSGCDDVPENNLLGLGRGQALQCSGGQFGEGVVGGGKNGQCLGVLERARQLEVGDDLDEGLEGSGTAGYVHHVASCAGGWCSLGPVRPAVMSSMAWVGVATGHHKGKEGD